MNVNMTSHLIIAGLLVLSASQSRGVIFDIKQIPFIGYAEFLFEGGFQGSQRIQSLTGTVSYCMGGLHAPPKDESMRKDREFVPWRFRAVEASAPESGPAPAPGDVIDATKATKAEVVLRVRRSSSEGADKYAWFGVEILKVLKNESGEAFGKELKVAAYGGKPGVPDGESTIYLERYNKIEKKLWMLCGGEAGTGVSHFKTP